MRLNDIFDFINNPILATAATVITAAMVTLLLHAIVTSLLIRIGMRSAYLHTFLKGSVAPLRLVLPMLAMKASLAAAPANFPWLLLWDHLILIAIIASTTWLAVNALIGVRDVIMLRYPADLADNLISRRIQTQTTVLMRTLSGVVILLGAATALMTFPEVRQVGASLLASAGIAGVIAGFAAKPLLGNLIAGLQIAMAQPIRIDDVVIVQGEWGRVEEITGAYVVVKIWDERRLIVPLQWFIENPFENWTRSDAQLIGSVFLWTDYRLPLEPLRQELKKICEAAPEWDRRVCLLQVTDTSERAMQLRALVSAGDSARAWDLRCRVREGLIAFLQREHAEALPRVRAELTEAAHAHDERDAQQGASTELSTASGRATPAPPERASAPPNIR
jgi:small-conductance mechanosensitive channel